VRAVRCPPCRLQLPRLVLAQLPRPAPPAQLPCCPRGLPRSLVLVPCLVRASAAQPQAGSSVAVLRSQRRSARIASVRGCARRLPMAPSRLLTPPAISRHTLTAGAAGAAGLPGAAALPGMPGAVPGAAGALPGAPGARNARWTASATTPSPLACAGECAATCIACAVSDVDPLPVCMCVCVCLLFKTCACASQVPCPPLLASPAPRQASPAPQPCPVLCQVRWHTHRGCSHCVRGRLAHGCTVWGTQAWCCGLAAGRLTQHTRVPGDALALLCSALLCSAARRHAGPAWRHAPAPWHGPRGPAV
jgi:hypothetical protein